MKKKTSRDTGILLTSESMGSCGILSTRKAINSAWLCLILL